MSSFANWSPVRFDPVTEQAFSKHMLERTLPLLRLASVCGALSFAGYQFWDLTLDPQALSTTGPLCLAIVLLMCLSLALTFLPTIRTNPKYQPFLLLFIYLGVAVGFSLVLSRLPGSFAAGMEGHALGMIFVPVLATGALQAAGILLPYFAAILLVMGLVVRI